MVLHAGDSGVSSNGYAVDGFAANFSGGLEAVDQVVRHRAGHPTTTWSRLVFENHFVRFPNLRIASVENGAEFLPDLFAQGALDGQQDARATSRTTRSRSSASTCGSTRSGRTTSTRWLDCMGADRVIFGSDWPHIEALPEPLDYLRELKDLDADDRRKVLYDNARELLVPRRT